MASIATAGRRCDLTGLPLTCGSDEALEWYNKALVAHVTYREDPLPFVSRALELDDSLLLGHCLVVSNDRLVNWLSKLAKHFMQLAQAHTCH